MLCRLQIHRSLTLFKVFDMAHPILNIAINAAHIAGDILRREFYKVDSIPVKLVLKLAG